MPPKTAAQPRAVAVSPSPPPAPAPPAVNDANDILVIQDFMDTIDQIPVELTRVHSDLNELGAVLYSTLCNLERKLHQLIDWVQNPRVGPEMRFQLLQEIAEEAARYKLGGDDKIRVAGGACDGIMAHQRHISDLLAASSLLDRSGPPSPYTAALTLPPAPPQAATRRGGRTTGSPFNDRGTPTKRKKKVKDIGKEDDDASSVTGKDDKKKSAARKKKTNRAPSPADSVVSTSYGKLADPAPRTARQIAAAAAKARAALKAHDDSDEETGDDEPRPAKALPMQVTESNDSMAPSALGVDLGASREGSASKSGGVTPAIASNKRRRNGDKRGREDEEDEGEDEVEEEERPAKRSTGAAVAKKSAYDDVDGGDGDATGGENEVDSKAYCTCRQISYGEMIGCDDDNCLIEWYHLACLGLDKTPEGNWICPECTERRKRNPKVKKPVKAGKRK